MAQEKLLQYLLESAHRRGQKAPGWHNPVARPIIGKAPIGKALHFKSAADRLTADRKLSALKSKGEEISPEMLSGMITPHTNIVPIWRGAHKDTAARLLQLLAPKPQPKEKTDAPSK